MFGGYSGFGQTGYDSSGGVNIGTTINPRQPIAPWMTQQSTNQGIAGLQRSFLGDPRKAIGFTANRGVSWGPAQMGRYANVLAQGNAGVNDFRAQQHFTDAQTNANSLLAGQTARDQEGLSLANMFQQQNQQQFQNQYQQSGDLMGLLQALMGGQ